MKKLKILNLYAGAGGNRKYWTNCKVTAVELNKDIASIYKYYFSEDTIIIANAHQYLLDNYKKFDFIWSSPPCPTHSQMRQCGVYKGQYEAKYPDMNLYQEIIFLKYFAKKSTKWVVENVNPFYDYLIKPQQIINRHVFWSNFYISKRGFDSSKQNIQNIKSNDILWGFDFSKHKVKNIRKDKILRNLVNPEIGLHLLKESKKEIKPLFNFNY